MFRNGSAIRLSGNDYKEMLDMSERCSHYRIKVDYRRNYTDDGYDITAECADCGIELDVVEVNGYEVK